MEQATLPQKSQTKLPQAKAVLVRKTVPQFMEGPMSELHKDLTSASLWYPTKTKASLTGLEHRTCHDARVAFWESYRHRKLKSKSDWPALMTIQRL